MEPCSSCTDTSSCPIIHDSIDLDTDLAITDQEVIDGEEENLHDDHQVDSNSIGNSSRSDQPKKVSTFSLTFFFLFFVN